MPLPGGGTTRIKRCQSIWSNHTPRSMRIRWAMVHFGRTGSPNIYFVLYSGGRETAELHVSRERPAGSASELSRNDFTHIDTNRAVFWAGPSHGVDQAIEVLVFAL
jgi:hypothetical protein